MFPPAAKGALPVSDSSTIACDLREFVPNRIATTMGKRYPVSIDLDSLAALRIEAEITNLMDLAGIPALQIDGAPAEPPPAELPTGKAPLAEVIHRLRAGLMIFNEDVRCAAIDLVETLLRQAREKLGDSDFDIIKGQLTDDLVGLA